MKALFPFRKKILKILINNLKLFPEDRKKICAQDFLIQINSSVQRLRLN
jgi:hypothetical protein